MILLLIIILCLISLSLRLIYSGVSTLNKIYKKNKFSDKDTKKDNSNLVDSSVKFIKSLKHLVDAVKGILLMVFPVVAVLDIIVFIFLVSVSSGFMLLLNTDDVHYVNNTVNAQTTDTDIEKGKSKILLIGDSRTVQLGITVFNMTSKKDSNDFDYVIGKTSSGDYLYSKGSQGLSWMKTNESDIDKNVDNSTAVVVNMGVNDCSSSNSVSDYSDYLNRKANDWKSMGADVYFVSVNPINDSIAKENGYDIVNSTVMSFNSSIKSKLANNIFYIDTYSEVESLVIKDNETPDGVHYNKVVYQKIKDKIWGTIKTGSELGEQLIAKADTYVGILPYVWGGTSLEDGADCSGFICALYETFDIDLWDYRVDLTSYPQGTIISSIEDARAGDILHYPGHVALYDGKGGRIHEPDVGETARHDSYCGEPDTIIRIFN